MALIDSKLADFAGFILSLADLAVDEEGKVNLEMERVVLNMPIEMEIMVNEDGSITLDSAPPTQQIETSFMPVFHQIRVEVISENGR